MADGHREGMVPGPAMPNGNVAARSAGQVAQGAPGVFLWPSGPRL